MNLEHVVAPTEAEILALLPVSELKAQQRVFHSAEDEIFKNAILSAYAALDGRYGYLNRSILSQTLALHLDGFGDEMSLPFPWVQQVSSVQYYDTAGVLQTLAPTEYTVDRFSQVPAVRRAAGKVWPSTQSRPDAVKITYVAGLGDADAVRAAAHGIYRAMVLLGGHYVQNREATYAEPRLVKVNRILVFGVEEACGPYRIPHDHS